MTKTINAYRINADIGLIELIQIPTVPGNPDEGYGTQPAQGAINDALGSSGHEYHAGLDGAVLLCGDDGWPEEGSVVKFAEIGPYPSVPGVSLLVGHDIETDTWSDVGLSKSAIEALVRFHARQFRGFETQQTPDGVSIQPVFEDTH